MKKNLLIVVIVLMLMLSVFVLAVNTNAETPKVSKDLTGIIQRDNVLTTFGFASNVAESRADETRRIDDLSGGEFIITPPPQLTPPPLEPTNCEERTYSDAPHFFSRNPNMNWVECGTRIHLDYDNDAWYDEEEWLCDNEGGCYAASAFMIGEPSQYDCEDMDSGIHPRGLEYCGNGVDDDCDGEEDEGCVNPVYVTYSDSDEDGDYTFLGRVCVGDAIECLSDLGEYGIDYSFAPGFDCNDGNSDVNSLAQEILDNQIDDDCDGEIDEPVSSARFALHFAMGMNPLFNGDLKIIYSKQSDNCGVLLDSFMNEVVDTNKFFCRNGKYVEVRIPHDLINEDIVFNEDSRIKLCDSENTNFCSSPRIEIMQQPLSVEVCDGIDDNGDGVADDGCDSDCDGYISMGMSCEGVSFRNGCGLTTSCKQYRKDCNDDDDEINPSVVEICNNGIDDNCDSFVDMEDVQCMSGERYFDSDGDGQFSSEPHNNELLLPLPLPQFIRSPGTDCNDGNDEIYLGHPENSANEEWCIDGLDNDCDGDIDTLDAGCRNKRYYLDTDGDGHYSQIPLTCIDCLPAYPYQLTPGDDCNDNATAIHPINNMAMSEMCDGVDLDCDGLDGTYREEGSMRLCCFDNDGDNYYVGMDCVYSRVIDGDVLLPSEAIISRPDGVYVPNTRDCDDTLPNLNFCEDGTVCNYQRIEFNPNDDRRKIITNNYPEYLETNSNVGACVLKGECIYGSSDPDYAYPEGVEINLENPLEGEDVVCYAGGWYDCDASEYLCNSEEFCGLQDAWVKAGLSEKGHSMATYAQNIYIGEYESREYFECCGDDEGETLANTICPGSETTDFLCCPEDKPYVNDGECVALCPNTMLKGEVVVIIPNVDVPLIEMTSCIAYQETLEEYDGDSTKFKSTDMKRSVDSCDARYPYINGNENTYYCDTQHGCEYCAGGPNCFDSQLNCVPECLDWQLDKAVDEYDLKVERADAIISAWTDAAELNNGYCYVDAEDVNKCVVDTTVDIPNPVPQTYTCETGDCVFQSKCVLTAQQMEDVFGIPAAFATHATTEVPCDSIPDFTPVIRPRGGFGNTCSEIVGYELVCGGEDTNADYYANEDEEIRNCNTKCDENGCFEVCECPIVCGYAGNQKICMNALSYDTATSTFTPCPEEYGFKEKEVKIPPTGCVKVPVYDVGDCVDETTEEYFDKKKGQFFPDFDVVGPDGVTHNSLLDEVCTELEVCEQVEMIREEYKCEYDVTIKEPRYVCDDCELEICEGEICNWEFDESISDPVCKPYGCLEDEVATTKYCAEESCQWLCEVEIGPDGEEITDSIVDEDGVVHESKHNCIQVCSLIDFEDCMENTRKKYCTDNSCINSEQFQETHNLVCEPYGCRTVCPVDGNCVKYEEVFYPEYCRVYEVPYIEESCENLGCVFEPTCIPPYDALGNQLEVRLVYPDDTKKQLYCGGEKYSDGSAHPTVDTLSLSSFWCPKGLIFDKDTYDLTGEQYCIPPEATCDAGYEPLEKGCDNILNRDSENYWELYNNECVLDRDGDDNIYEESCCLDSILNGYELYQYKNVIVY